MAREKLTRAEQKYNYGIAVGAVLVVALLVVVSPHFSVGGAEIPVLVLAILVGAFLFGLAQMVVGISRRRRYLRSLGEKEGEGA